MMAQLKRAGLRQVQGLERQIEKLNERRHALLEELGIGGSGKPAARGGRRTRSSANGRVDWDKLFTQLPKTPFGASHVLGGHPKPANDGHLKTGQR
jgi:hypothetical protein